MAQKFKFTILSFFLKIDFLDTISDFLTVCLLAKILTSKKQSSFKDWNGLYFEAFEAFLLFLNWLFFCNIWPLKTLKLMNDQNKIVDENIFLKQPPNPLFIWDLVYLCNNVSIFVKATLYFSLIILLMWKKNSYFSLPEKKNLEITSPIKNVKYHHIYIKILFFENQTFFPFLILEKL